VAIFHPRPMKTGPIINTGPNGLPGQDAMAIMLGTSEEARSLTAWRQEIQQAWSGGAASTLELARLTSLARASLPYGSWGQRWQAGGMPFSKRKGDKLVAIGQGLGGVVENDRAQLPPVFGALYYLALLGQTVVEELIRQRLIYPRMSVEDARALLPESDSKTKPKKLPAGFKARLARLTAWIRAEIGNWPEEQRKLVHVQLLALADEIHGEKPTNGAESSETPTSLFNSRPSARFLSQPSSGCPVAAPLFETPGINQVSFSTK